MKIDDKRVPLIGKTVGSSGQELRGQAKSVGRGDGSSARADRVTLSGGSELSKTASEISDERRKKIEEIQSLLRAGGAKAYFQARPDVATGITQGISSEVALMNEITGKR